MKVLMVEPGKSPYAAEIESGLKSLQAAVGGDIQAVLQDRSDLQWAEIFRLSLTMIRHALNRAGNLRTLVDIVSDRISGI